jgi:hypothetical protein
MLIRHLEVLPPIKDGVKLCETVIDWQMPVMATTGTNNHAPSAST